MTIMKTLMEAKALVKLMPISSLKVMRVKVMTSQILRMKMRITRMGKVMMLKRGNISVETDVAMIHMKVNDLRLC